MSAGDGTAHVNLSAGWGAAVGTALDQMVVWDGRWRRGGGTFGLLRVNRRRS